MFVDKSCLGRKDRLTSGLGDQKGKGKSFLLRLDGWLLGPS